jgi:DNA-binding CsgD family transcriptional regulator
MLATGDRDGARTLITSACEQLEAGALDRSLLLICGEAMADTATDPDMAAHWADKALAAAHPDIPAHPPLADLVRAHALSTHNPARAADLALGAAEALERCGLLPAAAKARMRAGISLAQLGDKIGARAALTSAVDMFTACGARLAVERANRELRRAGAHVPAQRGPGSGLFGLSARELQVGTMVVEGSTNKHIAETLFLSIRTVETHLTHIKSKLGVRNRTEIARLLGPLLDQR